RKSLPHETRAKVLHGRLGHVQVEIILELVGSLQTDRRSVVPILAVIELIKWMERVDLRTVDFRGRSTVKEARRLPGFQHTGRVDDLWRRSSFEQVVEHEDCVAEVESAVVI